MRKKTKGVCIRVHPKFFDIFESQRKNYENKFKVTFSQIDTSELMSKEMLKKLNPKTKIKSSRKYYPKKIKQRGKLYPQGFMI